jgi:hypothetical protein
MSIPKIKIPLITLLVLVGITCFSEATIAPKTEIDAKTEILADIISLTPKEFLKNEVLRQGLTERDYVILETIIQCESSWSQFWERDYNGHVKGTVKVSNGNIGLAQINKGAHETEYTALGLDPFDENDNLTYAVILYRRNGVRDWEQWSGHCWKPKLAKKGIFIGLEKLEGQYGGQCVAFIQDYYDAYDKFKGDAANIVPNSSIPEVGSAVLTTGHTALIYKIEGETLFLIESNYHYDEKITIGRTLNINDLSIRGYFKF